MSTVEARDGFLATVRERRKLGVTLRNAVRIARELKRDGEAVNADAIAMVMVEDNPAAFVQAGERDWESFFAALVKFLEAIMPIIQMFMAFGV